MTGCILSYTDTDNDADIDADTDTNTNTNNTYNYNYKYTYTILYYTILYYAGCPDGVSARVSTVTPIHPNNKLPIKNLRGSTWDGNLKFS